MSKTYLSAIIVILSQLLPAIGVEIGSDDLTTTISSIITIVGSVVILVRRYMRGDIRPTGVKV